MSENTPTTGLQHDALFYDDDRTLASVVVSFVREGVERGEQVFVAFDQHPVQPLLTAVFRGEPGVVFTHRDRYSRPVRVLDQYQRTMDDGLRRGVQRFRVVGYHGLDDTDLEWVEWLRYEAAFAGLRRYPLQAMCTWDTRRLTRQQAAAFRSTHPCLVGEDGPRPNQEYVDPAELVGRPEHRPSPDPAQQGPPTFENVVGPDLRQLRLEIYPVALSSALPRVKLDDFVKAVGAVVGNAHQHGKGPVRLRLWVQPHRLVGTVTDHGPGIADPFLGYLQPPRNVPGEPTPGGGLGLWATRQLCDTLDYGSSADGFDGPPGRPRVEHGGAETMPPMTLPTGTESEPHWTEPGAHPVADGVHRIPLPLPMDGLRAVNVYALETDDGLTLIDGGWAVEEAREAAGRRAGGDRPPRRHHPVPGHPRAPRPLHAGGRRAPRVRVAHQPGASATSRRWTWSRAGGDPTVARLRRAGAARVAAGGRRHARPAAGPVAVGLSRRLARRRPHPRGRRPDPRRGATPGHTQGHFVFADRGGRAAVRGRPRAADDHAVDRLRAGARRPAAGRLPGLAGQGAGDAGPAAAARARTGHHLLHARVDELSPTTTNAWRSASPRWRRSGDGVRRGGQLPWTRHATRLADLDVFNAALATMETHAAPAAARRPGPGGPRRGRRRRRLRARPAASARAGCRPRRTPDRHGA